MVNVGKYNSPMDPIGLEPWLGTLHFLEKKTTLNLQVPTQITKSFKYLEDHPS